jgi:alpha-glucoside transport system permease protein
LFGVDPTHVPALLGPTLITPALMSAFVWGFLGLVVVVFRVVLASIPAGREDMVRAEGGGSLDVFRDVRWPVLRRVTVVLFVLVALATARSFDLLLIMAPASVQNDGQTLSVYVWRASSGATPGTAAALSVVWLIVVGLAVAVALAWKRAEPGLSVPVPLNTYRAATTSGRSARGRVRLVAGRWIAVLAGAAWFLPLLLLAVTSLHSAPDAATRGWTAPLSFRGYLDAWRGLSGTLGGTAVLAGTVTLVVLSVAILAGYALVVFRPLGSRPASALLVAASVVPIQTIARPIDEVLGAVRLSGSGAALFLVHVAMGVPLITLLLRNAFEQLSLGGPAGTETVRGTAGAHRDTGRRGRREQVTGRPLGAGREAGRALMVAARPAVYAAAVLEFVQVWNDLVVGLLFGGSLSPVGVTLFGQARDFVSNAAALAAGSMLVSLPPLILVLLARKRVVDLLVYGVLT